MRVSFKWFRRSLTVYMASAIGFVSMVTAIVPIPVALAKGATNTTVEHSALPPCMRLVSVSSNPCGATIYIDGIQVGRTPMSFPMPKGRYTLFLLAPGHQPFAQRILVPDAPLKVEAKLVPEN